MPWRFNPFTGNLDETDIPAFNGEVTLGSAASPSIFFTGDYNTGIYSPGADQVAISTNGTERVEFGTSEVVFNDGGANYDFRIEGDTVSSLFFVDASTDRVGLGTNSPGAPFTTHTNSFNTDNTSAVCELRSLNSTPVAGTDIVNMLRLVTNTSNGNTAALIGVGKYEDSPSGRGEVKIKVAQTSLSSSLAEFSFRGDGQFTVPSSVGVGTTSPSYQLELSTDSAGKPSTNTWTIVSDERIKEEIELADLDLCYKAVKKIPLKRFKWKDQVYTEEQAYDRRKLGWIAQDVEAVFPKAVRQHKFKYNQIFEEVIVPAVPEELDDDGNVVTEAQPERIEKGELISEEVIEDCRDLNSDQLYAAMYGAIQKLITKVETLEAKVAALESA